MHIVFVGDVLPAEIFRALSKVAPSSNNLQLSIIDALHEVYKEKLHVISKNFKLSELNNDKRIIEERLYILENDVKINTVKFVNNRVLKNITGMYYLYKLAHRIKRKIELERNGEKIMFIVFNPYYQQSLPINLAKGRKDILISIIGEGLDIRYIRDKKIRLYDHISHLINIKLFKKNRGIITYCANTVEKYAPNVEYIELLHSSDMMMFNGLTKKSNISKTKMLLYAGMLVDCYGINIMLDLMKKLPGDYNLVLCGNGSPDVIDKIKVAEKNDNRIKYLGLIQKEEVIKLEVQADILLIIRVVDSPVNEYIANYCQPSKVPEYLMSGTPIIATKIPAIPSVFDPFLNYTNNNVNQIADKVLTITKDTNEYYLGKAIKGKLFAQEYCTNQIQFSRLLKFIQSIEDGYNVKQKIKLR